MEQHRSSKSQNNRLYWANLLHFYQPPDQERDILERIVNESYHPVIRIFEQIPSARATINIPSCLLELLIKTGLGKIVSRLKKLADSGQIEFTATPRFHPFLPFIPDDEIDRQLNQNSKVSKSCFGLSFNPVGFFSPELAYDSNVVKAAVRHGYRWLVVDEVTIAGKLGQLLYDHVYMDKSAGGLVLVPRNRRISEALAGSIFSKDNIRNTSDLFKIAYSQGHSEDHNRKYIFTANDVEHFGHHQKGRQTLLRLLYKDTRLVSVTVSELLNHIRKKEYCNPKVSDWTSTPDEVNRKQVFYTWNNPSNTIHKLLWELYRITSDEMRNAVQSGDILHHKARDMLGAAAPSCSFFWASCRPWWYGVYPENTATNICLALFSLMSPSPKVKEKAFKLRQKIYDLVKQYNETGEAKKLQQKFLKSRNIDVNSFYERFG
jgi:hypothetical protein